MKKNVLSKLFTILITAVVTLALAVLVLWLTNRDTFSLVSNLLQVDTLIRNNAIFDFSEEDARTAAISAYAGVLDDRYVSYKTAEEYQAYLSESEGNLTGIGVVLHATNPVSDGLFIYQVKGNSPAKAAGLQAGDLIVQVNGNDIDGRPYQEVYEEMSVGVGQTLNLKVRRNGEDLDFSVPFSDFVQTYVDSRMIGELGYIRIYSFSGSAASEFQDALNALLEQGAKGFIFDLRNNLGGGLDIVESILNLLIPKDEMVVLQYKNSEQVIYSKGTQKTDAPMVVLMNGSSASSSELMASCLRDVNGSLLIGTTSYGKGIGQTTYRLADGSSLKLTTFYFETKSRVNYHGVGLTPDVEVTLDDEQTEYFYALDENTDPQLRQAIQSLRSQLTE